MSTFISTLAQPTLVAWLVKSTALLVLALAMTSLLRRASAGTRHLVWLSTLAGILLLPAVSLWTPLRLAILPSQLVPSLSRIVPSERLAAPSVAPASEIPSRGAQSSVVISQPLSADHQRPAADRQSLLSPDVGRLSVWTTALAIWGAAALALLGWLAFGALSVRRIVRTGRVLADRAWTDPLCEIADRLDLDAVPRLLSSPLIEMPFACGVLQPTIVLPASAETWNDSRRRAVLFHELAHVKRHDLVGHTLGRIASALYWFHPLVWTAARRLRAESERACDDLVLSCGARASDYADHLLDIVISVRRYGAPATAMPMARRRELEGRVLAILDPAVARIGPGRLQTATMLVGLGALALSVAAMAPARDSSAAQRGAQATDSTHRRAIVPNEEYPRAPLAPRSTAPRTVASTSEAAATPAPSPAEAPTARPEPAPGMAATTHEPTLGEALGSITKVAAREAVSAVAGVLDGKIKTQGKQGLDSAKVALMIRLLHSDPDASVRRMAAWALSEAGNVLGAADALAEAVRSDEDDNVREMAAWALADSRRESARRALSSALRRDPSANVRETAAWALANDDVRDDERGAIEEALASDESDNVRETAAWALGYSPRRPAARALVAALGDKSPNVRESAAWALAETEDEDVGPAVEAAFRRESNANVRMAELRALTFMHVDNQSIIDAALASKDAEIRARAIRMIAGGGSSWPQPRPRPRPRPMP